MQLIRFKNRELHLLLLQKFFGYPLLPDFFKHLIPDAILRWRRIIAMILDRMRSRHPIARMEIASYHLLLAIHSRLYCLGFIYSIPALFPLSPLHFFPYLLTTMNTLPDNHSIQLTEEEALIHDFDHVSIHPKPQAHSFCLFSTSIPFEEQPTLSNAVNSDIQELPPPQTSPPPTIVSVTQNNPISSTINCPLPSRPLMTPTVITSSSKGKDPMYPEPPRKSYFYHQETVLYPSQLSSGLFCSVVVCCLPTRDKLAFVKDKSYLFCDLVEETPMHISWECPFVRALLFSGPFPLVQKANSAVEVELLAIFWALQMGKEVGNSSIAIFFDAQMVVRALKERSFPPYWEVRRSAKKVLNFDVCNFLYIPRVDNRGAVNVAKKARSKGHFDGVFDKEGPPVVIPNYLLNLHKELSPVICFIFWRILIVSHLFQRLDHCVMCWIEEEGYRKPLSFRIDHHSVLDTLRTGILVASNAESKVRIRAWWIVIEPDEACLVFEEVVEPFHQLDRELFNLSTIFFTCLPEVTPQFHGKP
ncbi:hypothetical protein F8388_004108 [Cannabis sativa]|uniref:RNase H type-1 domain-containing protein n=1 Tax=Cannabis sativa TaxID=3483 RepID=A0A7J6FQI8_CANSA|nr:hypothetical protein F8388_004108 [Cannabis sativa]